MALSAVFGTYADKREVQATAALPKYHDHSGGNELWLDYVSDLGDGFDATYSVAYLLASPSWTCAGTSPGTSADPARVAAGHGRGPGLPDGVDAGYEERTKGPYNAALPHADEPPTLFAIPGNHDWYDGLTSFLRFFCQGRWVGGWSTEQRRSYFAVKLPQRWWLMGIDIQFDTYIDAPQIAYFRASPRTSATATASSCAPRSRAGSTPAGAPHPRPTRRWTTSSPSCSGRHPSRCGSCSPATSTTTPATRRSAGTAAS